MEILLRKSSEWKALSTNITIEAKKDSYCKWLTVYVL